ncbi:MAG: UDP-N-acetylmuramate dehydrogenase [Deltaproteobacteria bacterium]|nr:UDP-N-acetylmuramate dehydrogenase [Deltaproteobacteria bacterium]
MRPELCKRLLTLLGERVRFARPLARHTSFRVGGPADAFVAPASVAELQTVLRILAEEGVSYFLLGGGTNILVSDKGVRGVVIHLGAEFNYHRWTELGDEARAQVGAARPLGRFVRDATAKGYGGIEFAEGIPGSVGGGLLMNAGAFGGELSRVVMAIHGVLADGQCARLAGEALGFAYRRTTLPPGFIVTEVEFRLHRSAPESIAAKLTHAQQKRQATQPHGYPNAGSIFKNPPGTYAGKLIEEAGLKGLAYGQAQVSEQHANFIVNKGGARAAEVKQLMEQVQRVVWEKNLVRLEPEVRLVGEWE